jgi:hypothetical protein
MLLAHLLGTPTTGGLDGTFSGWRCIGGLGLVTNSGQFSVDLGDTGSVTTDDVPSPFLEQRGDVSVRHWEPFRMGGPR